MVKGVTKSLCKYHRNMMQTAESGKLSFKCIYRALLAIHILLYMVFFYQTLGPFGLFHATQREMNATGHCLRDVHCALPLALPTPHLVPGYALLPLYCVLCVN
jgi:hypothetical protein